MSVADYYPPCRKSISQLLLAVDAIPTNHLSASPLLCRLTYALIWRLISREIGGSGEKEGKRFVNVDLDLTLSSRSHAPPRRPHSPFSFLALSDRRRGNFREGNFVVVLLGRTEDNIWRGTKSERAKEGGARQENSENVGFHKGTITIVKREGRNERPSLGYLGGPTAKFSPSTPLHRCS